MERLTDRSADGSAFYKDCFVVDAPCGGGMPGECCAECGVQQKQCDELAAYEDLSHKWNLTSEQMDTIFSRINALGGTDLMAQYRALGDIADLTAIVKARDDGRVAALPCKAGERVSINNRPYLVEGFLCTTAGQWKVRLEASAPSWVGNQRGHWYMSFKAFERKTRAEAEAALKGAGNGDS